MLNNLSRFFRLFHISYVLLKHGLDEIVLATHLFRPLRFVLFFSPYRFTHRRQHPRGVRIREALEELGPIFVKFGQLLSTRPDIIPQDILKELIQLQDNVPPFPGQIAEKMVERAFDKPLSAVFQAFEITPLASASVAQVHAAVLTDGRSVVVKVLRPHVHRDIQRDVGLLKTIARFADRYSKKVRIFKPREIVSEFEKILIDELDLMREAGNASQLRRHFLQSPLLYIPEIHWDLTKHNVMVMERIYGIPIHQIELLKNQGFNLKQLAERAIEIFFTQAFRDCFFHADLHPGNLLVSPQDPSNPKFIAVDFGIVGSLSPKDQRYLAENFLAFFKRDYRRVTELHIESGWLPTNARIDEFEAALRTVCEPLFERQIQDISIGNLLLRLFQTAAQFQINIQPQLILLQKTLLSVEGLGRTLYPTLDLWQTAKPFLEKWMKTQIGPKALTRKLKASSLYWIETLPELPYLISKALRRTAEGEPLPPHSLSTHSRPRVHSLLDFCLGVLFGLGLVIMSRFLLG